MLRHNLAAGGLSLVYLAVFRSWLKATLTVRDHPSNVDAVVGKTGVVTKRVALHEPGMVKVGDEVWRAELAGAGEAARIMPGATLRRRLFWRYTLVWRKPAA